MTVEIPPEVVARARKEVEARWLPDRIPDGWPPFDYHECDACSGGVRQVAQHCCVIHDGDYWYGRTLLDKILADFRLWHCICKYGWEDINKPGNPSPYSAIVSWSLLAFGRWLGVTLFGWNGFYRSKPHKRRRA